MERIYYKAVKKVSLQSVIVSSVNPYAIGYKINQWVYPKNPQAPLFVFNSLEAAKLFTKGLEVWIFTCHIQKHAQQPKKILGGHQLSLIGVFWEKTNLVLPDGSSYPVGALGSIPPGTTFASAVKLLEKIDYVYN